MWLVTITPAFLLLPTHVARDLETLARLMEDKETAPGTVLLAVDVARRQAELRRRSVIMTEDPVEAAEWLRTYRHPMTELISIGPWASYSAW